jgi:hypothetical protein
MTAEELRLEEERSMGRRATLVDFAELAGGEVTLAVVDLDPIDTGKSGLMYERRACIATSRTHPAASIIVKSWWKP